MRRTAALVVLLGSAVLPGAAGGAAPTPEEVVARAHGLGVGTEAERIRDRFLPGARLLPSGATRIGQTRLGGRPDLPHGTRWPSCRGRRLAFLMQVELAALVGALPGEVGGSGQLLVFADLRQHPDGLTAIELVYGRVRPSGCLRVLHVPSDRLARRRTPRRVRSLRSTPMELRPTLTVPNWEKTETIVGRRFGRRGFESWLRLSNETASGVLGGTPADAPLHRLLGWADPVQEDPTGRCGTRGSELRADRLLLQLDWDPRLRFEYGDGGSLFITIPGEDLRAGRFSRLCADFQQH